MKIFAATNPFLLVTFCDVYKPATRLLCIWSLSFVEVMTGLKTLVFSFSSYLSYTY